MTNTKDIEVVIAGMRKNGKCFPEVGEKIQFIVRENEHALNSLAIEVLWNDSHLAWIAENPAFLSLGQIGLEEIQGMTTLSAGETFNGVVSAYNIVVVGGVEKKLAKATLMGLPITKEKKEKEVKNMPEDKKPAVKLYYCGKQPAKTMDETQKAVRFCPQILQASKYDPFPVTISKGKDGRLAVVVPEVDLGPKGFFKDVTIGYIDSPDNPSTIVKIGDGEEEYKLSSIDSIQKDVLNKPHEVSIIGQVRLVNFLLEVKVFPDESLIKMKTELEQISSAVNIAKKEKYLRAQGFTEDDLSAFWRLYSTIHKEGRYVPYLPNVHDYEFLTSLSKSNELLRIMRAWTDTVAILLVGPSAAGKDVAISTMGSLLDVDIVHIVANGNTDADILVGTTGIENDNGVGITKFQPSLVLQCLNQPYGGILRIPVIDEVNFINAAQLGAFNELFNTTWQCDTLVGKTIENNKVLSFSSCQDLPINPFFRILMTANIGFEGTSEFNKATWNRVDKIPFSQGMSMKKILLSAFPQLSDKDAQLADALWNAIKKEAAAQGCEVEDVGPRNFKSAARRVLNHNMSMKDALEETVLTSLTVPELVEALGKFMDSI